MSTSCKCGADGKGPCAQWCPGLKIEPTLPRTITSQPVPETAAIVDDGIELHAWPPEQRGGQHVQRMSTGVIALHTASGIAAVCTEHRSMMANREGALERLRSLERARAMLEAIAAYDSTNVTKGDNPVVCPHCKHPTAEHYDGVCMVDVCGCGMK